MANTEDLMNSIDEVAHEIELLRHSLDESQNPTTPFSPYRMAQELFIRSFSADELDAAMDHGRDSRRAKRSILLASLFRDETAIRAPDYRTDEFAEIEEAVDEAGASNAD